MKSVGDSGEELCRELEDDSDEDSVESDQEKGLRQDCQKDKEVTDREMAGPADRGKQCKKSKPPSKVL